MHIPTSIRVYIYSFDKETVQHCGWGMGDGECYDSGERDDERDAGTDTCNAYSNNIVIKKLFALKAEV